MRSHWPTLHVINKMLTLKPKKEGKNWGDISVNLAAAFGCSLKVCAEFLWFKKTTTTVSSAV